MAGGYGTPQGDSLDVIGRIVKDILRRLRELERPTGTSLSSLVAQVQAALANINATVATAISANSYTKTTIDNLIANPPSGSNVTGDVTASGRVVSTGVINSPGTKANTVTVGYSAVYIDSSGNMGGNTSSRRFKQDISAVESDVPGFLGLATYRFRYIDAVEELGDDAPWEFGLMAEDVVKVAPWACFYEEDGVTVRGINYDRLIVAAINVLQDHERRLKAAGL
jgi:hypothetical protein